MNKRKIGSIIFGVATLVVIIFAIYKIIVEEVVGFNEVIAISSLLMMYLSSITWGSREENDGILQEEELGQQITEKSSKLSYFLLTFFILGAVAVDELMNNTVNIFLLTLLGLSMIILPIVEFFYAKKYQ
ncbi:hypothetical protein [Aneurinibacillus aneurinilyticus]|uniref:hypothetical protein n=1 Tax=Aneurinibacillus aneurinilyticus TaxID=1391 RepID=UPI003526B1F7